MINIAIIDDEIEILNTIESCIRNVKGVSKNYKITVFQGAEQVLKKIEQGIYFDIIFSDIQLGNMSGIEFGEEIRKIYPDIYFVFITSFPEFAAKSYSINAYQYILKDDLDKRLPEVFREIIVKMEKEEQEYRFFKRNTDISKINYKDIIYIKKMKSAKYVQFYTKLGEFRERTTLEKVMMEMNNDDFIMIERGYIVNIKHIVRLNGNVIYLQNGDEVTISRSRLMEVKKHICTCWRINHEFDV